MRVAEAAVPAFSQKLALAEFGEVGDQRLVIVLEYLRADRDAEHHVGALGAMAVAAHAVAAGLRLEVLLVAIVDQGIQPVDSFREDVAAAPAVAAVGPAELDELLAAKGDRARAAVAGADIDLGLVEEFHTRPSSQSARVSCMSNVGTSTPRATLKVG